MYVSVINKSTLPSDITFLCSLVFFFLGVTFVEIDELQAPSWLLSFEIISEIKIIIQLNWKYL